MININLDLLALFNLLKQQPNVKVIKLNDKNIEDEIKEQLGNITETVIDDVLKINTDKPLVDVFYILELIKKHDNISKIVINDSYILDFETPTNLKTAISNIEPIIHLYYKEYTKLFNYINPQLKDGMLSKILAQIYAFATKIIDLTKFINKIIIQIAKNTTGLLKTVLLKLLSFVRRENRYVLFENDENIQKKIFIKYILEDNLVTYDIFNAIINIQLYDYDTGSILNKSYNFRSADYIDIIEIPPNSEIQKVFIVGGKVEVVAEFEFNKNNNTLVIKVKKAGNFKQSVINFLNESLLLNILATITIIVFVSLFGGNVFEMLFIPLDSADPQVQDAFSRGLLYGILALTLKLTVGSAIVSGIMLTLLNIGSIYRAIKRYLTIKEQEKIKNALKELNVKDSDIDDYRRKAKQEFEKVKVRRDRSYRHKRQRRR